MILSVSRRTDIPAFYSEWLINRLKAGYVYTRNPMNHLQVYKMYLSPDIIDCIVFWTKDPKNMLDKLSLLDTMGYRYYFQFTLTPYGKELEQDLRDKEDIIKTFIQLSGEIGKERVLWRYDPIIVNDTLTIEYHIKMFDYLCKQLSDYTTVCTISFIDLYTKLRRVIDQNLIREIEEAQMLQLASVFLEIGRGYGIELRACSEKIDLMGYGINSASCIDKTTVEKVCGYKIRSKHDLNQRSGCGCTESVDLGVYNTCRNGCIYCYANYSIISVDKNYGKHNPNADILIGNVSLEEKVTERNVKSCKVF